jgi:hypothetical protein
MDQDNVIEEIRVLKDNRGQNVGAVGIAKADGAEGLRLLFVLRTKSAMARLRTFRSSKS